MKSFGALAGAIWLAAGLAQGNPLAACPTPVAAKVPAPSVYPGLQSRVVTSSLQTPRGIVFDNSGRLLVVDRGIGVKVLTLKDDGGSCVTVSDSKVIIPDTSLNHGIDFLMGGTVLLVSDPSNLYAYSYNPLTGNVVGNRTTLVSGMFNTDHDTRTVTHSKAKPGTVIINRGSSSNIDNLALNKSSGHAQVKAFDVSYLDPNNLVGKSVDFTKTGTLLAWGVRNDVGIAEAPDGGIWTVENSVDNISRYGTQFNQQNPGEKLQYMGTLVNNNSTNQGSNFGYPVCYAAWNPKQVPKGTGLQVGQQFSIKPGQITDKQCQTQRTAPRLVFDAHMAPLDIKFGPAGNNAFITFHGSFDRPTPQGYKLSRVAFSNGQPVAKSNSNKALTDLVRNANPSKCPDNCFRPVAMAFDNKNRLFFSSDATGEIYIVMLAVSKE